MEYFVWSLIGVQLFLVALLIRLKRVGPFQKKMINVIFNREDWREWKYLLDGKVDDMMLQFWRPLKSFYPEELTKDL